MLKRIIVYALVFVILGQNAFAAASSAHVTSEAQRVITTVNARITSAANSIVAALNSLLRDNKGMNVAQAVREFQATSTQDSAALAKQLTAALDAHQANMIAYEQRKEALEDVRKIDTQIAAVKPDDCAAYAAKKSAPLAQATQAAYSAAGSNTGRKMTSGAKAPQQMVAELYTAQKADPRAMDAGIMLKPGCDPVMAEETAFADELSVVGGYECAAPNLTIPKEDAEKAAQFVARMIVPNPVTSLPIKDRKTPSGVMFEAERAKVRARQSYLLDIGQDSLSKFQATRDLSDNKDFFMLMGVPSLIGQDIPNTISEMDYLRYHLMSRWDNPKFQEFQKEKSVEELLRELNTSVLMLATIQFRQLELNEKKTPAEMQFFEAVQDGPTRVKLRELEAKAGS